MQFVANRSPGGWRAHGRYLGREGAQQEGERGLGFDAQEDRIAIDKRLDGWQKDGDRRLWKVILSPEQGQRLDLREHTRELISAMERDLGTRLEWVAIDHHNTTHPHVHVAIRGVNDQGRTLAIPAEYVRHGMRERSQQLATQRLGYRTAQDRARARERGIEAPRFGELDAILEQRAGAERLVRFDDPVPASDATQTLRLQLIGRLKFLEVYGLAEPLGGLTWHLHELHRPLLRQMQLLRDVQKSVARGDLLLPNPDAPQMLRELGPGERVRGRVAGVTFAEVEERVFLALEGTGGYVYLVPETPEIEQRRREGDLLRGAVVTLERRVAEAGGRRATWIGVHVHGRLEELEAVAEHETVLDLAVLERLEGVAPEEHRETRLRGFAQQWETALMLRRQALMQAGLVIEAEAGDKRRRRAAPGALEHVRAQLRHRERTPLTFPEVEQRLGKPIREAGTTWGMSHRGRLAAYAEDQQGRYAMLEDWHGVIAVPTRQRDLAVGTEVRARSKPVERGSEATLEDERRRGIVWQLSDLEREREHDRGRGR